ncbi:DUF2141 domain-containing protein [Spirosoma montaniterrae]|uniref:DUF2141 domain-containing protein n=1 Tax=Spirosoma montaniterrae TaxID=1178516 RepID=A0A1P9X1H6_9BACT|nr:DUF2141 domain-containing protein [Spirosoma montaniterrae]AQG81470.1 hypothetical protein AWR27_20430 [Spirosoma montaniterrae]
MKTLVNLIAVAFFFASSFAFGQTTSSTVTGKTYTLTVVIPGFDHRNGNLRVGIANSEQTFSGESFKSQVVAVPASGGAKVTFEGLPAGRYAVRMMQDLNGNNQMDYNGSMPTEPFGFSNITMLMGPPSFGQSAFDLNENKTIEVSLMEM